MSKKAITPILGVLLIALLYGGIQYNTKPQGNIFLDKAQNCYKKQDISCTLDNLEKAFDLSVVDYKQQDLYINLLLKSDLDIKTQERLVKFLDYDTEDYLRQKVEYILNDFQRQVYRKYPENYISAAVFDQKVLRWGNMPITYGYENTQDIPSYFINEIDNAFLNWQHATNQTLVFKKDNNTPNIIIKFNHQNPASSESKKYVVAYTTPSINLGTLRQMIINFYVQNPQGEFYSPTEIYNTALHEIVHSIGFMGHSNTRKSVMYPSKENIEKNSRIKPTIADINTIKLLYSIQPDITNTPSPAKYVSYIAIGDKNFINQSKLKEARSYIKNAPTITAGYLDLAGNYFSNQQYDKAIKVLERSLKVAKTNSELEMIYYNLAVAYYYIDNTQAALENLKSSLQIKDTEEKRYLLAGIYEKSGDKDNAIKEYNTLLSQHPDNIEYVIPLTNLYILDKKYFSARKVLKTFIKNNPEQKNSSRLSPYGMLKLGL
jgi:tetratricopeptide (TPR) repeat protein